MFVKEILQTTKRRLHLSCDRLLILGLRSEDKSKSVSIAAAIVKGHKSRSRLSSIAEAI